VPGGAGDWPILARRDLNVLFGNGVLYVDGGDAEFGELVGIEPDAASSNGVSPEVTSPRAG